MKFVMFVWKSGILYEFHHCLWEISPCLHEFCPVGWVAVRMCAATVGWRNLRVAGRYAGGSGGVVGQKNTAHASSSPTCALEDGWQHEHPSRSSFIIGKGTSGQQGRLYFGYPGQDPNSPSQQIQIPRSPWNFAMCCFHGLARCPCIARNIKMHFLQTPACMQGIINVLLC